MKSIAYCFAALIFLSSCDGGSNNKLTIQENMKSEKTVPEWTKNAVIYEVNIRQFTEEGTFAAFEKHLVRIRNLGVDILWFMPIQPIGEKNRKGDLGSYYSIKDYTAVNPEFGTMEEFKQLVAKCQEMGFKVLLDWVANHSAWDHKWVNENPDWYIKDSTGNICSPVPDWSDVAGLNYQNSDMRKAMIDEMKFWLTECNIDGFRCDVAGMVPTDFWEEARPELDKIKPVFMLAEWEDTPELHHNAFDMSYTWKFHHLMCDLVKGSKNIADMEAYFHWNDSAYRPQDYRMYFTCNHDENSWNGTVFERFGDAYKSFVKLTFAVPGMPLIYGGQEAGLDKVLRFFYKDTIEWRPHEMEDVFKRLITIKHENPALWNGLYGGDFCIIQRNSDTNVFAFTRSKDDNSILFAINLSNTEQRFTFPDNYFGDYHELVLNEAYAIYNIPVSFKPWEVLFLRKK